VHLVARQPLTGPELEDLGLHLVLLLLEPTKLSVSGHDRAQEVGHQGAY